MTRLRGMSSIPSEGTTPPSTLLRAHAPHQTPLADLVSLYPRVFAGGHEPLLAEGASRRYLCVSVPRCLDPYPGGVVGARAHYFPTTIGLPQVPMGRLTATIHSATSERGGVRSRSHSFMFRPRGLLPPRSLPPQGQPHRAAVAFTSQQNTGRYLPVHRIG